MVEILLFVIQHEFNTDNSIKTLIGRTNGLVNYCSYNKKIIDEYKKSLIKIVEMNKQGLLTKKALADEENAFEIKAIELDKKNFAGKMLVRILRRIQEFIPSSLRGKLGQLFVKVYIRPGI
jgi:hypothetical protein